MAQKCKSRQWLAPILFDGSCEGTTVLWWIKEHLLKTLNKPGVIVMDNAPFHPKAGIRDLLEKHGHIPTSKRAANCAIVKPSRLRTLNTLQRNSSEYVILKV